MVYSILDIEADELLDKVSVIHCLCYQKFDGNKLIEKGSLTDYGEIKKFVLNEKIIIGHKIITYDIPVLEKILHIKITARLIDTLGVSWYLYPERTVHGLDEYGAEFGIMKPPINNWISLPKEEYIHRCNEDVRINVRVWETELEYLKRIYTNVPQLMDTFLRYISFKLDCAREQEEVKWKLDRAKCEKNLAKLIQLRDEKMEALSNIMPVHTSYKIKEKPKVMYKKDGTLSSHGQAWVNLLTAMNLPEYHNGALKLVDKVEKGNPGSFPQLKVWLFSLGWKPTTFKYVKDKNTPYDKKTPPRKVPQLTSDDDTGLCQSVKDLFEKEPGLVEMEDLFIIRHRIGLLQGFLESIDENDMLKAEISGFTNTMRMQHKKPIANLPTIPKKYWEMIRECLIARDKDHILCGSDMSGLEDNTKQHYMYFYDPDYVTEMRTPGFDAHIDMAIQAKHISYEEGEFYKWYDHKKKGKEYKYVEPKIPDRFANHLLTKAYPFELLIDLPDDAQAKIIKAIKPLRLKDKKTNFAATYGAGGPKIALTANISDEEGFELHKVYWKRNKAVKDVAENTVIRVIFKSGVIKDYIGKILTDMKKEVLAAFLLKVKAMWLFNPVSQFYYSLRYPKDIFSTLNQGTGVYCFDMWTRYCREQEYKISMQYHDEHVGDVLRTDQEKTKAILLNAIDKVNERLKLNIKLSISIDFGDSYADIH